MKIRNRSGIQAAERTKSWRHIAVLLGLLALVVAFVTSDSWVIDQLSFVERILPELNEFQRRQLDMFTQQSSLLTTLSTALIGALGAFVIGSKGASLNRGERWALVVAVALASVSLYFGYIAYQEVTWMLSEQFFNLGNPHVEWIRRLQFFSFIGSVICSFYFVLVRTSR